MNEDDIEPGLKYLKDAKPKYLALLNEPDFSFGGYTKKFDPVVAGQKLAPYFDSKPEGTKYLSPAVAFFAQGWLQTFVQTYPQYVEKFDIISYHHYSMHYQEIIDGVKGAYAQFKKPIWVTETSPAGEGCTTQNMPQEKMIEWMNGLVSGLRELGYVEKLFWNCGEAGEVADANACNPSLTNDDGSPTALGTAYGQVCGGSGGQSSGQTQ